MNNLDPVAFREQSLGPIATPHHLMVELDGETLGREPKMTDQLVKTDPIRHVSCFAINMNAQGL